MKTAGAGEDAHTSSSTHTHARVRAHAHTPAHTHTHPHTHVPRSRTRRMRSKDRVEGYKALPIHPDGQRGASEAGSETSSTLEQRPITFRAREPHEKFQRMKTEEM